MSTQNSAQGIFILLLIGLAVLIFLRTKITIKTKKIVFFMLTLPLLCGIIIMQKNQFFKIRRNYHGKRV